MMTAKTATEGRDLVLTRVIDAPCEAVFNAWTEPELLKQWFAPMPWTAPFAETDVRAGGSTMIVMRALMDASFRAEAFILKL